MKKVLTILPIGQRDPKWASQRLGTVNGSTIGSDGCVITSQCMLFTFKGKSYLPNQMDDYLTNNNLYAEGNLWVPTNISKVWDQMKVIKIMDYENVPAPIDDIKNAIDRNQPPTVWLLNEGVRHNVLAVGYEDNQIIVNDPWRGDQIKISDRWGDSAKVILEVDYYEGPITNSPQPPMDITGQDKQYQFDEIINDLHTDGFLPTGDSTKYAKPTLADGLRNIIKGLWSDRLVDRPKATITDQLRNDYHLANTATKDDIVNAIKASVPQANDTFLEKWIKIKTYGNSL